MMGILYVVVCAFLSTMFSTYVVADEYKLLDIYTISSEADTIDGPDGFSAIKFDKTPLTIPVKNLKISDQLVSPPFIINVVFIMFEMETTCIFSLMDEENNLVFNLCFVPIGPTEISISIHGLQSTNFEQISFSNDINKWTKIMLYIDINNVRLRLNCFENNTEKTNELVQDITFSSGSTLIFGNTIPGGSNFMGAIQEVKIYTDVNEFTIKEICNLTNYVDEEYKTYLNSTVYPSEPEVGLKGERGEPGERGDKGDRGDKGEKGDVGQHGIQGDKGQKGEKGQTGETGHKGEPGNSITGPPGPQGIPGREGERGLRGLQGDVGECQCSETNIMSLLRKMPEMKGPPGEPGYPGDPGPKGLTGQTGPQGEQGSPGLKGTKGDKGDIGNQGPQGEAGLKGDAGVVGAPGPQGPRGEGGERGPPGPACVQKDEKGKTGEKGDRGPEGPKGQPGRIGDIGPVGPRGEVGEKGEKGTEGRMGIEGPKGEKGVIGYPGNNGVPGIPGRHGNHGKKGEKGETGDIGAPGLPASLSSILDTETNPKENDAIVQKLRGYKGEIGEKGDKGDKGDQGLTGMIGPPGKDGKDGVHGKQGIQGLKGEVGPIGLPGHKGDQGEPGPAGQVPPSHIALMKGPKGVQGLQGKPGPRGSPGKEGKRGVTGPTGRKGSKGDKGSTGTEGKMGHPGVNGTVGEKGQKGDSPPPIDIKKLKGEKGERGDNGIAGTPGKEGPQGPPGSPCKETRSLAPITGPPGPPGPPGVPGAPGPQGLSIVGPKGEPGNIIVERTDCTFASDYNSVNPEDEDEMCTSRTVIFKTSKALIKKTTEMPLGTLAYVMQEKNLLLRVDDGWQYVVMGSLFPNREPKRNYNVPLSDDSTIRHKIRKREHIYLIALNEPYSGRIYSETDLLRSGYSVANSKCYRESKDLRRRMDSTFVAFLANRVGDLKFLVKLSDINLPVVNLYGKVLFNSWQEMFNGSGAAFATSTPNIFSFNGRNVLRDFGWPEKAIWHGADSFGERSKNSMCEEWQRDSSNIYGAASSLSNNRLLNHNLYSCDRKLIVLCVGFPRAQKHSR